MEEGRRAERIQRIPPDNDIVGDVSETGMCLNVDHALKSGTLLSIELSSRESSIVLKARVVYAKPVGKTDFHTGLQFVDLTDKQKQDIFDMVDSFAKGVPIRAKIVKP